MFKLFRARSYAHDIDIERREGYEREDVALQGRRSPSLRRLTYSDGETVR